MDGLDARFHGTVPIISTVRTGRKCKNNCSTSASSLLNEDDPTVLRQCIMGMQDRQRDAFPFGDNLIAQFFIIQSELSDQQRERLTSAMSLRNISLENYSYEMLKTHYHELFITTRTSIQDPSIRPQGGNRSNTFFIIEQGEYEGEEGFWVEDEEGLEGFMSNNDEETFWVLEENDAFIARKVAGRNFRFKKRKGKGKSGNKKGSHQRGGFKPFRKSGSGGKANMANENYDPYDQAYWGKGKGKKENQNSNSPMMETRVIHPLKSMRSACSRSFGPSARLAQRARPWRLHLPAHVGLQCLEGHGLRHVEVALPRMRMAKEKADMTKENPRRSQSSQRRRRSSPPSSRLHHPQSLPMPVGQTKIGINHGHGTNKAGAHPMRHPFRTSANGIP